MRMPAHLAAKSPAELWAEFRENDSNLWQHWPQDYEHLDGTVLEVAEVVEQIEGLGGTIEINLDVTLPLDCPLELDADDRALLHERGETVKELLRFHREANYNLRELAAQVAAGRAP